MKNIFILLTILLLSFGQLMAQPIPHTFVPSNIVSNIPALIPTETVRIGNNCFGLSRFVDIGDLPFAAGVWDQTQLNLNNEIHFSVDLGMGAEIGNSGRGDGFSFILQNQGLIAPGPGGGNLGIPAGNSIAIEVDAFNNDGTFGDIGPDHLALVINGNQAAPLAGPLVASTNGSNIEDGAIHNLTVFWTPLCDNLQRITVFFDGNWRFQREGDFINTAFNGNTIVNWGIMASKGSNENIHLFCFDDIQVTVANTTEAVAQIEDAQTLPRSQFICGEDIFLDGSASTNYNNHRIQIRRRDINSPPNTQYDWVGSMEFQGNINTVNLSELAAQNLNFDFDGGYEYQITLVLRAEAPCSWITDEQTFTVIDGGTYEANFQRQAIGEVDGTVTVNSFAFDQTPNSIVVNHHWRLFFAGPNGETNIPSPTAVPGYPTQCCNSTTSTFQGLDLGTWYFVRHGIWNECTGWKETRKAFKVEFGPENGSGRRTYIVSYGSDNNSGSEGGQSSGTENGGLGKLKFEEEATKENQISVFPNPLRQGQQLTIQSNKEISKVEVIGTNGKIQNQQEFSGTEKQVSIRPDQQLPTGLYFVKVYLNNGETELKKLMIH
ncbi:MAG: T9SS type A sorting domain-containing protein [Saprospiraceae bacterium]